MTDKFDFQWCLGSAALINCRVSSRYSRPHFLKGWYFKTYCSQQKLGVTVLWKVGRPSALLRSHTVNFFLFFSLMFCLLVQKDDRNTVAPRFITEIKKRRYNQVCPWRKTRAVQGATKNVQNTGKTHSLSGMSLLLFPIGQGRSHHHSDTQIYPCFKNQFS